MLLGWQWPNQASENGRRADLVGMNTAGGLVVFEAKGPQNGDSPLMAMLEGLDYLVHLTLEPNLKQIHNFVEDRKATRPEAFRKTSLLVTACHEVVVLAPSDYYTTYARSARSSGRGHGWREFAGTAGDKTLKLQFRYAKTDFKGTVAQWV